VTTTRGVPTRRTAVVRPAAAPVRAAGGDATVPGRSRAALHLRRPSTRGAALASSVLAAVLLAGCTGGAGDTAAAGTSSRATTSAQPSTVPPSRPVDLTGPDGTVEERPVDDDTVDDDAVDDDAADGTADQSPADDGPADDDPVDEGPSSPGAGDQGSSTDGSGTDGTDGAGAGGGTEGLPGWPLESTPVHGARLWGVYLAVGAPGDPALQQVLADVRQLWPGAGLGELGCDQGAAAALGHDPAEHAVAVYFTTRQHVTEFQRRWEAPWLGAVQVTTSCAD
jgi:hypothetical protein